jgi:hypothetical protein
VWDNGPREAVLVRRPDQLLEAFARYLITKIK